MVVGAGIGVTPFASILRSVQLRALDEPRRARESTIRWGARGGGGNTTSYLAFAAHDFFLFVFLLGGEPLSFWVV